MLNKFLIFLLFIVLFLLLNFFSIKSYFYNYFWEKNYFNKNFEQAEKYFKKSKNTAWVINIWNFYYKNNDLEKSKDILEKIVINNNSEEKFVLNFLLWNIFYRIWEKNENLQDKKEFFLKSINNYKKSLEVKNDEKVEKNKKFVEDKLKELNSEENNFSENQKENFEDSQETENSDENSQKQEQSLENNNENVSKETLSWQEDRNISENDFSPEHQKNFLKESEKQKIQEYEKYLKESQKELSDNFWKVYKNNSDDFFWDIFFEDVFFDNSFWTESKKDW